MKSEMEIHVDGKRNKMLEYHGVELISDILNEIPAVEAGYFIIDHNGEYNEIEQHKIPYDLDSSYQVVFGIWT